MTKKLDQLKLRRQEHFDALFRAREYAVQASRTGDSTAIHALEGRRQTLPDFYAEFRETQTEIETCIADGSESGKRVEYETIYFDTLAAISAAIYQLSNHKSLLGPPKAEGVIHTRQAPPAVQLPLMSLPRFNGEYDRWLAFRDSFVGLVDRDPNLTNIQKLFHLRSCLGEEVLKTIEHFAISGDNYELAWKFLSDRYERSDLIAKHHVSSIMNHPRITKACSRELRSLFHCIKNNVAALKSLGVPVEGWDLILFHVITDKLDPVTAREWDALHLKRKDATLQDLLDLLNDRCELSEGSELKRANQPNSKAPSKTHTGMYHIQTRQNNCIICSQDHAIFKCEIFSKLGVDERIKLIKTKGLCLNCLRPSHTAKQCRSSKCRKCKGSHHSLLHKDVEGEMNKSGSTNSTGIPTTVATLQTQTKKPKESIEQVLLPTAVVFIMDARNQVHRCRALLDSGAMSNFITTGLCERMGLAKKRIDCAISGVGQIVRQAQYSAQVRFKATNGATFQTQCIVLDTITSNLPVFSFSKKSIRIPNQLTLADPNFDQSQPIDLLLGSSIFWEIMKTKRVEIPHTRLVLQETKLGWIVGGSMTQPQRKGNKCRSHIACLSATEDALEQCMTRFWELEEITPVKAMSPEEQHCEELFTKTHRRDVDGRFIVEIPFKPTVHQLGESRDFARKRFEALEHKLTKNPELYNEYRRQMQEYLSMGHMKRVQEYPDDDETLSYYIPHHAVLRQDSLTTRVRVVFDASMKTSTGVSLNDVQYVGPSIQAEIFTTLINFRLPKYVISGDISKMYRMVKLSEEHKRFHRIFWRDSPQEPLQCFELQTVTFGTASAPFLAIRCLKQLAMEHQKEHPQASRIISNNFYVDDLIYGTDTIAELISLQHEITAILNSAGFVLRKWLCNNDQIYPQLKLGSNIDCSTLQFGEKTNKTLGPTWDAKRDEILYRCPQFRNAEVLTKRIVLSELAKVFDPLGLVGPLLVGGKILMQELWKLSIDWDQQIPEDLSTKWIRFRNEIAKINTINIPRRVRIENCSYFELHGFCDASEQAYGACVFIKSCDSRDGEEASLLCSKSRVAPLKTVSLPRLELCGALLLARLIQRITEGIDRQPRNIYCWSDSTIVLAWIRSDPSRWKTFVANRVSEIQTLTDSSNWHHVPSSENPADILSRGATVEQLVTHSIWWSGPTELMEHIPPNPEFEFEKIPELKALVCTDNPTPPIEIIDRFSNFEKIVRITAYCLRFVYNCRAAVGSKRDGELTIDEVRDSEHILIRAMQQQSFAEDYRSLKNREILKPKSKLLSLSPFLDGQGLLRVGGRIQRCDSNLEVKHPILLDPKHKLTKLIITQIHQDRFHCGPSLLLSLVRQRYWPINGRNLAKGVVRTCRVCFLANPRPSSYVMGQLPRVRVTPSFPFEHVGIDYAGPVGIKDRKTRKYLLTKSYICLFICLSTKAIHLESVTDLTTDAFIACLNRFISRRGKPNSIYSDNGKNFVGANAEIKAFYNFIDQNKSNLNRFFVKNQIRWHFTPARSPTFGGLWEAGVKRVKFHLHRMMKSQKFHFEELSTLLCQIEAILNSRPLTPLPCDPTELTPLTPAHFLIGRTFDEHPETTSLSLVPSSRLKRYEHLQILLKHFWKRWSREYMSELQVRTKWKTEPREAGKIQVGRVVLVKDDDCPPFQWPLGRITEVHPGKDGVIRVVSVKLRNTIVKRAVGKICVLPEE